MVGDLLKEANLVSRFELLPCFECDPRLDNRRRDHLEHLFETAQIIPQINQVETNVQVQNYKLQEFCMKNGIFLEAYAPLMSHHIKELLDMDDLKTIAKKKDKTIPQIALRFLFQRDIIIIPKSVTPKRIDENFDIYDFELTDEEMDTIFKLNKGRKLFPDPDNFLV